MATPLSKVRLKLLPPVKSEFYNVLPRREVVDNVLPREEVVDNVLPRGGGWG
jgi:hypothetical protein